NAGGEEDGGEGAGQREDSCSCNHGSSPSCNGPAMVAGRLRSVTGEGIAAKPSPTSSRGLTAGSPRQPRHPALNLVIPRLDRGIQYHGQGVAAKPSPT